MRVFLNDVDVQHQSEDSRTAESMKPLCMLQRCERRPGGSIVVAIVRVMAMLSYSIVQHSSSNDNNSDCKHRQGGRLPGAGHGCRDRRGARRGEQGRC